MLAEAASRSAKAFKVRSTTKTNCDKLWQTMTNYDKQYYTVRYPTAWKELRCAQWHLGCALASHARHIVSVCFCQNLFSSLRPDLPGLQGNVWVRSVKREGLDSKALRARNWKELKGTFTKLDKARQVKKTWKTRKHSKSFKHVEYIWVIPAGSPWTFQCFTFLQFRFDCLKSHSPGTDFRLLSRLR